jgi:hypothetical protein
MQQHVNRYTTDSEKHVSCQQKMIIRHIYHLQQNSFEMLQRYCFGEIIVGMTYRVLNAAISVAVVVLTSVLGAVVTRQAQCCTACIDVGCAEGWAQHWYCSRHYSKQVLR